GCQALGKPDADLLIRLRFGESLPGILEQARSADRFSLTLTKFLVHAAENSGSVAEKQVSDERANAQNADGGGQECQANGGQVDLLPAQVAGIDRRSNISTGKGAPAAAKRSRHLGRIPVI